MFIALPLGGIAFRVNLFSAVSAASAVVLLYTITRWLLPPASPWRNGVALAASLFFAFTPLFWSQATIAEVYAFNAFLITLVWAGVVLWSGEAEIGAASQHMASRTFGKWLVAVGLGLGLAHHLTILFIIPGALILWRGRVRPRELFPVLMVAGVLAATISFSLFLRAWRDPPINWGDPRTLENWLWVVSGQLYRGYPFGLEWAVYPLRLSGWAKLLFEQFGTIGVALGLWGGVELYQRSRRMGLALGLTFALYSLFAIGYNSVDSDVYLIPVYLVFTLAIAIAFSRIAQELAHRTRGAIQIRRGALIALALILILFPAVNLVRNFAAMDLSGDTEAVDYGRQVFAIAPENALIVADGDRHILALWYYRDVECPQSRVLIVAPGLLTYTWYIEQLRRHNPDWTWPPATGLPWDQFLRTLVADNIDRRPVFWTSSDPQFQQVYEFRATGPLYQAFVPVQP